LSMILSVFSQFPFGHDIVWLLSLSLWPWCCLSFASFPLSMILSVFVSFHLAMMLAKGKVTKARQYHDQSETD
jgi:ABC-type bacteriocin/lantibiotic exporter with double-glycine peptidase domain